MLFWLWLFFPNPTLEPIKLESLGTYQSLHLQLYKCGSQYLALVANEPRLSLFNAQGNISAVYSQSGHGAEDLHKPQFLGATTDRIYILSDHRRLLVFDNKLRLLKSTDSGLPPYITQGLLFGNSLGKDRFLLYTFLQNNHLLHHARLGKHLSIEKSLYHQQTNLDARGTYQWLHRNRHFVADMVPADSDYYLVQVRDVLNEDTKEMPILTELVAPIDNFNRGNFPERAILSEMVFTGKGYIVELAEPPGKGYKGTDPYASLVFFWDFFNTQGTNLKREQAGDRRLKPVRNSDEVFVVKSGENDADFLAPFNTDW